MKKELSKKLFGHTDRSQLSAQLQERLDSILTNTVAPIIFDFVDVVLPQFAEQGVILESGTPEHITEVLGAEFCAKVTDLGNRVSEAVRGVEDKLRASRETADMSKRVRGFLDGWAKDIANRCYGPANEEFFSKYGDQTDNFMCLVFPGQEVKHSAIKLVLEWVGQEKSLRNDITSESRKAIAPFLPQAAKILDEEFDNLDQKRAAKPKRAAHKTTTEWLSALDRHESDCKLDQLGLKEVGRAIRYLEKWVEGKPRRVHQDGNRGSPEKFNPVPVLETQPAGEDGTAEESLVASPKKLLSALKRVHKKSLGKDGADEELVVILCNAVVIAEKLVPLARAKGEDISGLLAEVVRTAKASDKEGLDANVSAMQVMAESM
ncbi:MAG: hypothetical protein HYT98_04410 [Candidatus Sungbacteria bacterium]|nr:hypothetical protein [Candidatus Sungbacteria bacterium]